MKKLVIVLVMLGVALPALSWAQTNVDDQPICTVLTKTLRYGMRNLPATAGDNIGEVLRLQTGLKSLGYLAGTELRSSRPYFGVRTRRAVKDFQADEDLSVTGVVASLTRKALKEATCNNDECPESPPCPSVAVLCVVGYHAVTTQADKCSCPVQDCVPDNGWQPRVTRPNNGEMWTARTTQEVKWDVVGAISPYNKVDIYLLATPCSLSLIHI